MRSLVLLALLGATPAAADPAVARIDALVATVGPLCAMAPSTVCYEVAFDRADRDADGRLALDELQALRADFDPWFLARSQSLTPAEANYTRLGLWIIDAVGLASLARSYDADGDGYLTRPELASDVSLDERRLGEVVLDPDAVDWASIRERLGALAGTLPVPPR